MAAVLEKINSAGLGPGFDKFIFKRPYGTAEVAAAAIWQCVPFHDLSQLLDNLLELGGPALACQALRCGYRLEFPGFIDDTFTWKYLPWIDRDFIDICKTLGVDTRLVSLALAVKTKDLQVLETSLPCLQRYWDVLDMMAEALKGSWRPGLELIARRWSPDVRWNSLGKPVCELEFCLKAIQKTGGDLDMDCCDILLGLGQPWPDAAFFAAFSRGSFALVERALQRGALHDSPARCMWCSHSGYDGWKGPQRHSQAHCMWKNHCGRTLLQAISSERPLWQRSASERRLIYVTAQVDQEVARAVAPDIKHWMQVVHSLFWWWGSLSRTHAATHGGPTRAATGRTAATSLMCWRRFGSAGVPTSRKYGGKRSLLPR
jgi:hypothetical protein